MTQAISSFLGTLMTERRELGWRGLVKQRGWKLVAVLVAAYLVRDTVLYIVIPLAIMAGLKD